MLFREIEGQVAAGAKAARVCWDGRAYVVRDNRPYEVLQRLWPNGRVPDGQPYLCISGALEVPFASPDVQRRDLGALGDPLQDDWTVLDAEGVTDTEGYQAEVREAQAAAEETLKLISLRTFATQLGMDPSALRRMAVRLNLDLKRGRTADSRFQTALVFTPEQAAKVRAARVEVDSPTSNQVMNLL